MYAFHVTREVEVDTWAEDWLAEKLLAGPADLGCHVGDTESTCHGALEKARSTCLR